MDVLLYTLEFQWPLSEDLFQDFDEIARRSCVSKEFNHKMKTLKDLRISYYLLQYPPLQCLSLDVQQFAVQVIKTHSDTRNINVQRDRYNNIRDIPRVGCSIFKEEGSLRTFCSLSQDIADFPIRWRFNGVTTNFNEVFPAATNNLFQMLVNLCFYFRGDTLKTGDDYSHENLAMWLIFFCNMENIIKMSSSMNEEDPTTDEYLRSMVFNECDHVHNGFRRLGNINATESTRKGYYYGAMQPGYIHFYANQDQKIARRSKKSKANEGITTLPKPIDLSQLFISRYQRIWSYQEGCRGGV